MTSTRSLLAISLLACSMPLHAVDPGPMPGESPARETRITQQSIEQGEADLEEIRIAGLRMFTTLFNRLDGYGDGPVNPADTLAPGGRPTLQGNGMLLRVNGLDGQGCIECHAIVSAATVPPRMGVGGVGSAVTNAIIRPSVIDVPDQDLDQSAGFNGRFANPPFVFGAGAVELLAMEMTEDLQALAGLATTNPGLVVELTTKGISFGSVVAGVDGELNTDLVAGVDDDLVVRPFGRKGEFATIRDFDIGAVQFHFGMQPTEIFGDGVDDDGDGVFDEVIAGELSALSIFIATMDRPVTDPATLESALGLQRFQQIGCTTCHVPTLETLDTMLPLRFPEIPTDPRDNVFYEVDLTSSPTAFDTNDDGGIVVPLFSDLRRHDMGEFLAESFEVASDQQNREFITARLWGIADTAPYLHDGRATTLSEAILYHGGEAQAARDAFDALPVEGKTQLLTFLRTLRTPTSPLESLLATLDADADDEDDDEGDDGIGGGSRELIERSVPSGTDHGGLRQVGAR